MATAFSKRRGLTYMKRNASLAQGSDSTADATVTAPWVTGVSLYLRWSQFEATRGTFTWDSVAASALEAKTNKRWLIIRISCGNDAPAHIYSDFGGPNGGVTKVTLNSGTYIQPAVWEQAYRNEYIRMMTAVNALLATPLTDSSGDLVGDYVMGVTIGSASQDNPEMASTTQWKAAGNSAAIKAALDGTVAAKDGLSGKGDQTAYDLRLIELLADQWAWGIQWHASNVTLTQSMLAFGTIGVRNDADTASTSDNDVNQGLFASTYFTGTYAGKIIGMVTNYSPTETGTGSNIAQTGTPYYENRANGEHVSIETVKSLGGAYAFQFDSSPINAMTQPTPANTLALMLVSGTNTLSDGKYYRGNLLEHYTGAKFVEAGAGLFGLNDTELQKAGTELYGGTLALPQDLIGGAKAQTVAASATYSATTTQDETGVAGKVIAIFGGSGTPVSPSVSDSHSNTYNAVFLQQTSNRWLCMWEADVASLPVGTVITVNSGVSTTHYEAAVYFQTGLAAGKDAGNGNNKAAGNQPSLNATSTVAGDVCVGAQHVSGAETFTPTSGWTQLGYAVDGTSHAIYVEATIAGAPGVQTTAPQMSDTVNAVSAVLGLFSPPLVPAVGQPHMSIGMSLGF